MTGYKIRKNQQQQQQQQRNIKSIAQIRKSKGGNY